MTSSLYYLARFAKNFGYHRKNHRMVEATNETYLLREAEAYLGELVWEKVAEIEELSIQYWKLRKYTIQRQLISEGMADCQERLDCAREVRSSTIQNIPALNQELLDLRTNLSRDLKAFSLQRNEIIADAKEVRRSYDELKVKLEVLTAEPADHSANSQEIEKVKSRLEKLKSKFSEIKLTRITIGEKIEALELKLDKLNQQLSDQKNDRRPGSSEGFHLLGDSNKEMSVLRAERNVIETQMHQLYSEIGRYISLYSYDNPACATAASSNKALVDVMRALRRSIIYNQTLADNF
jgi:chromosome segregation ATPase